MDREVPDLSGEVKTLSYEPVFVGPYSTVFRGKLKTNNELVAIKVLNPIHGAALHTIRRKIERERRTWGVLCHPNIVPLYGFAEDEERFQPFGAFISPWFQRGDLAQYLRGRGALAPHEERSKLWEGVVAGVAYLHGHNPILIHGDLKPRNILISEGGDALICDFGLTRICLEEGNTGMTTTTPHTGTERYLAYELVMAEEDAIPTTASDIYATGCIGLEIIFQEIPYSNHRGNNLRFHMLKEMQAGNPPAICPQGLPPSLVRLWGLISWCWDHDPLSRPRAYNLSSHLAQVPEVSGILDTLDIATSDSHLPGNLRGSGNGGLLGSQPRVSHQVNFEFGLPAGGWANQPTIVDRYDPSVSSSRMVGVPRGVAIGGTGSSNTQMPLSSHHGHAGNLFRKRGVGFGGQGRVRELINGRRTDMRPAALNNNDNRTHFTRTNSAVESDMHDGRPSPHPTNPAQRLLSHSGSPLSYMKAERRADLSSHTLSPLMDDQHVSTQPSPSIPGWGGAGDTSFVRSPFGNNDPSSSQPSQSASVGSQRDQGQQVNVNANQSAPMPHFLSEPFTDSTLLASNYYGLVMDRQTQIAIDRNLHTRFELADFAPFEGGDF